MSLDLIPGSPEWARRVSPSKAAAMLGISPWDSPYAMWRKMRGDAPWDEETEAMERGNLCEPAVLAWWRKHHEHENWREQVTLTVGDWCVATPDAICGRGGSELEIVEAKTAADLSEWGEPGTDAIPVYYLTQVYVAMHVANLNDLPVVRANVPVLGGYRLSFSNYVVEYDAEIGADLLNRLKAFHDTLDSETPPPLDGTTATYDVVRKLHPDIDQGAEIELTEAEAVEFVNATQALKAAEARDRLARAVVIERMGRAQFAYCNGTKIARRQPNKAGVSFVSVAKTTTFADTDSQGDAA